MKNQIEFNPVCTKIPMLKEWNNEQFKAIEKAITKHFKGRDIQTHTGAENFSNCLPLRFNDIDNSFGLAYTSTGIFACYGVCNIAPYFDADKIYQYSYFTIGENGSFYAILQDVNENELCIEL